MTVQKLSWPGLIGLVMLTLRLTGCSTGSEDAFRVNPKATPPAVQNPPQASSTAVSPAPSPAPAASAPPRRPVAMPPGIARPEDVTSDFPTGASSTAPPSGPSVIPPPPNQPQSLPAAAEGQYVRADVGVGQKGRSLQPGFLTTPVQVYFRSQEHVAFRIQVPHALQLFEAEHGRKPESHEEFWREIIEKNGIRLPQLPPGHRYVYDPQQGQLMVEVPAGSPPP